MTLQIDCPATYPPDCKIVFVGEAPGKEEINAKEGFIGPAGQCLQRACSLAGITWLSVGKSNVCKRRPPDNKFQEAFYKTSEEPIYTKTGKRSKKTRKVVAPTQEYKEFKDLLVSELQSSSINLVVACGNEALEALTGFTGITNYRGSIIESQFGKNNGDKFKVLAIEHPSYILRNKTSGKLRDFWLLVYDLKKAGREMQFPEIRREPVDLLPNPTYHDIIERLYWLQTHPNEHWTLDFESHKYTGEIKCFAVGYRPKDTIQAFAVGIQDTMGAVWTPQQELDIWTALREMARANPFYSNQNASFDIYYLLRYGIEPSGVWMDTMLAHSTLYPEFPKSLAFQLSFYFDDIVYYKSDSENYAFNYPMAALKEYCCKDAAYTRRLIPRLDEELRRRNMFVAYHGNTHFTY